VTSPDFGDLFGGAAGEQVQRMMIEDLAEVPVEELREQFRQSIGVLDGFLNAAGSVNRAAFTVMHDARYRAGEALRRLEA
jgi:hypothetical protein